MSDNKDRKNKFLLRALSKKQLRNLKKGKLPVSFFLGFVSGINIQAYIPNKADNSSTDVGGTKTPDADAINADQPEECIDVEIPTTMKFASGVNDDMSFKEAYEAARSQVGDEGFFNWKGNSYHTLKKEEWDILTQEDKALISEKIQENSNFEFTKVIEDESDTNGGTDVFEIEDQEGSDEKSSKADEEAIEKEEIEEITIDDLITDDGGTEDYEYVELEDFAETHEIISGLNDGEAEEDEYNTAEGIADNNATDNFLKKISELENINEDFDDFF